MQMECIHSPTHVGYLSEGLLDSIAIKDCSNTFSVLNVELQESVAVSAFDTYSWVLEQAKGLPSIPTWQTIETSGKTEVCECAPPRPDLQWSLDKKGVVSAHEDRRAAATFERAIKLRPPVFQVRASSDSSLTRIQVGVNLPSLLHRAKRTLACSRPMSTAWRLLTDHAELAASPFPRFNLRSNANDSSVTTDLSAPRYLRGTQTKSLAWMMAQEAGKEITVSETEEEIHSSLGWRLEARAQTIQMVRGGVLADHP